MHVFFIGYKYIDYHATKKYISYNNNFDIVIYFIPHYVCY
jgi:hypothetical protein